MKKADTECNHFLLLGAVLKTDVTNEVLFVCSTALCLPSFAFRTMCVPSSLRGRVSFHDVEF